MHAHFLAPKSNSGQESWQLLLQSKGPLLAGHLQSLGVEPNLTSAFFGVYCVCTSSHLICLPDHVQNAGFKYRLLMSCGAAGVRPCTFTSHPNKLA